MHTKFITLWKKKKKKNSLRQARTTVHVFPRIQLRARITLWCRRKKKEYYNPWASLLYYYYIIIFYSTRIFTFAKQTHPSFFRSLADFCKVHCSNYISCAIIITVKFFYVLLLMVRAKNLCEKFAYYPVQDDRPNIHING